MHIKSKNDNILNTTSKLKWNQQNQKKKQTKYRHGRH
jgi:hypothetical protein